MPGNWIFHISLVKMKVLEHFGKFSLELAYYPHTMQQSHSWRNEDICFLMLFRRSVVSNFLRPHGRQRPRLPLSFTIPQSLLRLMSEGESRLLFWSHLTTTTHKWKSSSITGWVSSPGPSNPPACTQAPIGIHFLMNLGRLKPCRRYDKLKEEWK